jgi:hypothetical protein
VHYVNLRNGRLSLQADEQKNQPARHKPGSAGKKEFDRASAYVAG